MEYSINNVDIPYWPFGSDITRGSKKHSLAKAVDCEQFGGKKGGKEQKQRNDYLKLFIFFIE